MKRTICIISFLFALFVYSQSWAQTQENADVNYVETSGITVDGIADAIWDNFQAIEIERDFNNESPTIGSAIWKAAWNEDGIYVLVHVEDDHWFPLWESSEPGWNSDHIELYFDLSDPQQDGGGPGDSDQRLAGNYQIAPDLTMDQSVAITGDELSYWPGVVYANTYNGTGNYTREYFVPWASIPVNGVAHQPEENDILGFDVCVVDRDALTADGGRRDRLVWSNDGSETSESWNNCDRVGLITLLNSPIPEANFAADNVLGNAPLTVNFIDLSTKNPNTWSWDFNNDGIEDATTQNPSHTFTEEGTYTVTLTVTNNDGSNTITKTGYIQVTTKPLAQVKHIGKDNITIDGSVDAAWAHYPANSISTSYNGETPTLTNATWKAAWNDNGVYVLVEVQDDIWMPQWLSEAPSWSSDRVELYFDVTTPQEDGGGASGGNGNVQIAPDMIQTIGQKTIESNGVEHANTYNGEGAYVREYFVPYTAFPDERGNAINPWLKNIIGFDVTIADRDATVSDGGTRNRMVWANDGAGAGESWNNCNDVGLISFYAEPIPQDIVVDNQLNFGDVYKGSHNTLGLKIFNNGLSKLKISGTVSSSPNILKCDIEQVSIQKKEIYELPITFIPSVLGPFSGTITINSNDPDEPSVVVNVTGNATPAPELSLSNDQIDVETDHCGGLASAAYTISNTGGFKLTFDQHIETYGIDNQKAGKVIKKFSQFYGSSNLVWIDGLVYATDYCNVYIYDTTNQSYSQQPFECGLESITFDGESFWLYQNDGTLKNYDLSFNDLQKSINLPSNTRAITWDGECFVVAKSDYNPTIYRINKQGVTVSTHKFNNNKYLYSFIYAPAHADGQLWAMSNDGEILQIKLGQNSAKLVNTIRINEYANPYSLGYDGRDYWVKDNNNKLKQVDNGITESNEWITISKTIDTLEVNTMTDIQVNFNSQKLNTGIHQADIIIKTNDPVKQTDTIKCSFEVKGSPELAISKSQIAYGRVYVNALKYEFLKIKNRGCDTLKISDVISTDRAFSTMLDKNIIFPGDSANLMVQFQPADYIYYSGLIQIINNAGNLTIPVTGIGTITPVLSLNIDQIDIASTNCNDSQTDQFIINNTGNNSLLFNQNILAYSTDAARFGNIIDKLNKCYAYNGMVAVGDYLYYLESTSLNIYNLRQSKREYLNDLGIRSHGITYDGTQLWICDWIGNLRNYDKNGNELGKLLKLPFSGEACIAYDGRNLLVTQAGVSNHPIYAMDMEGRIVKTYQTSDWDPIYSMTWAASHGDGQLWAITNYDEMVQINLEEETFQINHRFVMNNMNISAIAYDGKDLWHIDNDYNLYKIDDGITEPDYIRLSEETGKIFANSSKTIDVTFNATSLNAGLYKSSIVVNSDDPFNTADTIQCTFTVNGFSQINISIDEINFGDVVLNDSLIKSFNIYNKGCDTLKITDIASTVSQFSSNITSANILPKDSLLVKIKFKADAIASYDETLSITSNEGVVDINLLAEGTEAPEFTVNENIISASVTECGSSLTEQYTINNNGTGVLNYDHFIEVSDFDNIHAGNLLNQYGNFAGYYSMTWVNNKIYATDWCYLYAYNPNDQSRISYTIPCASANIVYDGEQLWIGNWDTYTLQNFDFEGNYLGTTLKLPIDNSEFMVAWDGECFLIANREYNPIVYRMDRTGKVISQNQINSGSYNYSMVYVPSHVDGPLWTIDGNNLVNQLRLVNNKYEVQNQFSLPIYPNNYKLAFNGDNLWLGDYGSRLYEIDNGVADPLSWITLSDTLGSVPAGNNQDINITFNSANLLPGVYHANLIVRTNDPLNNADTIACEFTVENMPVASTSTNHLIIADAELLETTTGYFEIENKGCSTLTVNDIVSSEGEFTIENPQFDVLPGQNHQVMVSFTPTSIGSILADLTISTNESDKTIQVSANGVDTKITSVTTLKADGSYKQGGTVEFLVNFSHNVTVSSTGSAPQLALNTTPVTYADYVVGSGTSELTFEYLIGTENSDLLDYTGIDALLLNGETIEYNGNQVGITLPAVGTFSNQHAIVIDNTAPTAVISSLNSFTNAYNTLIEVTITFNEPVEGFDLTDLTLTNSTADNLQEVREHLEYAFSLTPATEGDYSAEMKIASVTDLAGNSNSVKSNKLNIEHDLTSPTLTITSSASDPTNLSPVTINFSFSEDVTGFEINDIFLNQGDLTNFRGSGNSYSVKLHPWQSGPIDVNVYSYNLNDLAGNPNESNTYFTYYYDTNKPNVYVSTAESNPTNNTSFEVNIYFYEEVSGFILSDLLVTNGTASNLVEVEPGLEYTADITIAGEGSVEVSVPSGKAIDQAGNSNYPSNILNIKFDTTKPDVVLTSEEGSLLGGNTIVINAEFTEPITGFEPADVTIDNGVVTSITPSDNLTTYFIAIDPATSGNINLQIGANKVTDLIGLSNNASNLLTVEYDATSPLVSLFSSAPEHTNQNTFEIEIDFSEPISGFDMYDISTENGSVSNFNTILAGESYSCDITALAEGNVKAYVAANVAADAAINMNSLSNYINVDYDITKPAPVLSSNDGLITNQLPFEVQIDFNEPVNGFSLSDLSVGNGSASNLQTITAGLSYKADITPSTEGNVTIDIALNTVTDQAGNNNNAATQLLVNYDVTLPTVAIGSAQSPLTNDSPFIVTFTFSEPVTGFSLSDIIVGNGTAANLTGSGISYSAEITPAADGNITVNVNASSANDVAGNGNTAATTLNITFDSTGPIPTLSGTSTNPTNLSPFVVQISFNEAITGFTISDVAATNALINNLQTITANRVYTVDVAPVTDGLVTIALNANAVVDNAGNGNVAASNYSLTFDTAKPNVTLATLATSPTNQSPIVCTIDFSEVMTGFTLSDISVTNGTANNLVSLTPGQKFTVDISPATNGNVAISINANIATDAAGNFNNASAPLSMVYDNIKPTITLSIATKAITYPEFTVDILFSEIVSGFTLSDIIAPNATLSNLIEVVAGKQFKVNATPVSKGTLAIDIPLDVVTDAAGNKNTASNQLSIPYDNTAPSVTLTTAAQANTNLNPIEVTIEFSEVVNGFTLDDLTITNGTASNLAVVTTGQKFKANISPIAQGAVSINIAAGIATDNWGYENTAATPLSLTFDNIAPVVTLTSNTGSITNNAAINVIIEFNESVSGFSIDDIGVNGANLSNFSTITAGLKYAVDLTPAKDTTIVVNILSGKVLDAAGNANLASNQLTIVYDNTAPTVTLTKDVANLTNSSTFKLTIEFNETVSGMTIDDITLTNANSISIEELIINKKYQVSASIIESGIVTIDFASAKVTDAAGNANPAAVPLSFIYDADAPTVSIASNSSLITNQSNIQVQINFSEGVMGFDANDIELINATIAEITSENNGKNYLAKMIATNEGEMSIMIPGNIVTDSAGNGCSLSNKLLFTYDITAPTVSITSEIGNVTNEEQITLNIIFSEVVNGFDQNDLTISNCTIYDFNELTAGKEYQVVIVPTSDGTVTTNIKGEVASDAAGNKNQTSNLFSLVFDTSAPQISDFAITNLTNNSVDVLLTANESGKLYYALLLQTDNLPSIEQVINGNITGAISEGNFNIETQTEATISLLNLLAKTEYVVYVVLNDALGNTSDLITLPFKTTDVDVNDQSKSITAIYPNPNNGEFIIHIGDDCSQGNEVFIYDATGRLVKTMVITEPDQKVKLYNMPNGPYLLQIKTLNNLKSIRFVIE